MNLLVAGISLQSTPIEVRERLALDGVRQTAAATELAARFECESAILNTCNRVEIYLATADHKALPNGAALAEFLSGFHDVPVNVFLPQLICKAQTDGVRHLFRVTSSLDSLIVGEGQIAGQVKEAFESALNVGTTGPFLNVLFQQAQKVAKRVRTETGISEGHVSVSSVAVDYVRQVFDHFGDKTILIIGAGKMGRLTLRHLQDLKPKQILVTNRSPENAVEVASACGGIPIPWENLDDALVRADIVLSTTGSPEPIVTAKRYLAIRHRRAGHPAVILDIAVPRDFDPAIHDGDTTFVFNIDDLKNVREKTLDRRRGHIDAAEKIVDEETRRFADDWRRRKNGQLIARLSQEFEAKRHEVLDPLMSRLNGKLSERDRKDIEGAFRLYQNKLLHGPISALSEASREGQSSSLLDAVRRLFRLD